MHNVLKILVILCIAGALLFPAIPRGLEFTDRHVFASEVARFLRSHPLPVVVVVGLICFGVARRR